MPPGERAWTRLEPRQRVGLVLGPVALASVAGAMAAGGVVAPACWAAGIVALMAVWWITEPVPLWATALLPLPLFPTLAGVPVGEILRQYFDPVNFMFMGGMMIAAAMEQWGLHRRMALGIVARIGTSPRRIVLGFMLATGFVSLWISNTAAAVMMFPIAMAVVRRFEEQVGREDPLLRAFGAALMLGLGYAASMAGIGTKIGTGTNLVFVKEAGRVLATEVTFLDWMKVGLPLVAVVIPLAWLYLVRVAVRLPRDEFPGGAQAIAEARAQLGPMRRGEKVALAGFLSAAFLWTFRQEMDFGAFRVPGWASLVPDWSDLLGRPVATLPTPLGELLGPRGAEGAIAVAIALALLLTPIERRPLRMALGLREAGGISWGLLVMLGGGFAMAQGVQRSGLSAVVGASFQGLPGGSPLLATIVVCLVTVAMSEVASNTATASILLPLLGAAAPRLGVHPGTLMFAATLAASFGFMLPAGTPANAVVFGSGYIRVTQMARSGLVVDVAGAVLIAVVCTFLAPWALGFAR